MAPLPGGRFKGVGAAPPVAGGGSGIPGGRFKAARAVPGHKKKKGHHGILGFVENLGEDVVTSVAGLPAGLVQTVEHPVKTAKAIGKSYKQTYGPLVHGDVSKFLHILYSHPLGPILDAATIVTLGGAGWAKAAKLDTASLTYRAPRALAGDTAGDFTKLTSHNPVIHGRKVLIKKMLDRLPYETPHVGEGARWARETRRLPQQMQQRLLRSKEYREYRKATRNLSPEEFTALHLAGNDIHPLDLRDAYVKLKAEGDNIDPVAWKVLENPKVTEAFDKIMSGDHKMTRAVDAADALGKLDARVKIEHQILDEATAVARPGKHRKELGEILTRPEGARRLDTINATLNSMVDAVSADLKKQMGGKFSPQETMRRVKYAQEAAGKGGKRAQSRAKLEQSMYEGLTQAAELRRDAWAYLERRAAKGDPAGNAVKDLLDERERLQNSMPDTLLGEPAAAHELRPTPNRPFYVPDVDVHRRVANTRGEAMGSGGTTPKRPSSAMENRGTLFRVGQLAFNPDILNPTFLATIKYGLADDIHHTLMQNAVRISKEDVRMGRMPSNYDFIPKEIIAKKTGIKRAQTIHPLTRRRGEAVRAVEELLPDPENIHLNFEVNDVAQRAEHLGDYLIVPKSVKQQMVGEFHRSTNAISKFLGAPTRVWRSLVLGLRVGFLVNNVVGNHLLYALHAAGPDGLRAYLNAVKRVHGESMVKKLIQDREIPEAMRADFMREFFPEQIESFGKSQAPTLEAGALRQVAEGKTGRRIAKGAAGLLPLTQSVAETNLRRALVEAMIRKSPQFRKVYRAMPRQTREFEAAAAKVLRGEGGKEYQRYISDKVDNVLGDYQRMSPFERGFMRGAFPFYSWYRAITRISLHLALDTPGRADLLTKIGQIGAEETMKTLGEIPDYLKGVLPIGAEHGGKRTVLTTQGINPFVTLAQLGGGATGLLTGKPGDTGKALTQLGPNPFALGIIENLVGKDLFTGKDLQGGHLGLIGATLKNVGTELPQVRVGTRPESKLYGRPTKLEAWLAYMGIPVKDLNVARAHQYARR